MFAKSLTIAALSAALLAAGAPSPAIAAKPPAPTLADAPAPALTAGERAELRRQAKRTAGRGARDARSGSACLRVEAPYKHVRITRQKQIYGHTYNACSYGLIFTTLARWTGSQWVAHSRTVSSGYHAFAYEFLCSNYGFGGRGSGYYANFGEHRVYSGGRLVRQWRWSGVRYLSC